MAEETSKTVKVKIVKPSKYTGEAKAGATVEINRELANFLLVNKYVKKIEAATTTTTKE